MTGRCNVCGARGRFLRLERGREGTVCGNCGSTSRNRAVALTLGRVLGERLPVFAWRRRATVRVLESSPRGALAMFFAEKFDYYATEYDPAAIAAGTHPRTFADFQKLHYEAGTFDLVIASDVFEHIRRDADAMRELHRVLRSGGELVLTVPYDHTRAQTIQRVDTTGPADVHVLPPQYHGGGGHTLAYREYGRDLVDLLAAAGFSVERVELDDAALGITPQSVFVARKNTAVELAPSAALPRDRQTGPMLWYRLFVAYKSKSFAPLFLASGRPRGQYLFAGWTQLRRDFIHARQSR